MLSVMVMMVGTTQAMVSTPSARLVEPMMLAQLAPAEEEPLVPGLRPIAQSSTEQLRQDLRALDGLKPSLGLPITLLVIGGIVAINGLGFLLFAAFGPPFLILAVATLGVSAPFLILGGWLLSTRIAERKRFNEEIELREGELQRRGPGAPPTYSTPPPQVMGPAPSMPLAVF